MRLIPLHELVENLFLGASRPGNFPNFRNCCLSSEAEACKLYNFEEALQSYCEWGSKISRIYIIAHQLGGITRPDYVPQPLRTGNNVHIDLHFIGTYPQSFPNRGTFELPDGARICDVVSQALIAVAGCMDNAEWRMIPLPNKIEKNHDLMVTALTTDYLLGCTMPNWPIISRSCHLSMLRHVFPRSDSIVVGLAFICETFAPKHLSDISVNLRESKLYLLRALYNQYPYFINAMGQQTPVGDWEYSDISWGQTRQHFLP
jgi:hypothetical protein